jgi:hypothetical protein
MKKTFTSAIVFVAMFVIALSLAAKEKTIRITMKGGNLANAVDITDLGILDNFNVWTGPGTSSIDAEGFIIQWARGTVAEPPKELPRYQVSFYAERSPERPVYVVTYCYDASSKQGFVYLPGPGEKWYSQDVSAILHGVEGNWFHARNMWDLIATQLIAKAKLK